MVLGLKETAILKVMEHGQKECLMLNLMVHGKRALSKGVII